MPALIPTKITGKVIWLGRVARRPDDLRSQPVPSVSAWFTGFEGEDHSGLTRLSCARMTSQYPLDTEIRNTRQVSIVSREDLAKIAGVMGLESIEPEWLGASMVVEGIPDFTLIPPSSRLQTKSGATLTVDMENRPCQWPAREIETEARGYGKLFKSASQGLRGVVAWVEREGHIAVGDDIDLHIPSQREWPQLGAVLGD